MVNENLHKLDLYELLGIQSSCSLQDVKKAYRKKALTCHPDKNPENPKAAELFHQLSAALEILTDDAARTAYDKILNGRKAAKIRHQQLDSRRKKFKEDLEERERRAQEASLSSKNIDLRSDEEKLQAEIERLRKEGSKQLEEEVAFIKQQVELEKNYSSEEGGQLILQWLSDKADKTNGGYSCSKLYDLLSKYGEVVAVVMSKKKGRAVVEFKSQDSAMIAARKERGLAENPLTVEHLDAKDSQKHDHPKGNSIFPSACSSEDKEKMVFPSVPPNTPAQAGCQPSDRDYENEVLQRLRKAEEQKRNT